jgi:hypothetical protein
MKRWRGVELMEGQTNCWRMTGDLATFLYDSSAIASGNPFVR